MRKNQQASKKGDLGEDWTLAGLGRVRTKRKIINKE
jgi:hypothetical protein